MKANVQGQAMKEDSLGHLFASLSNIFIDDLKKYTFIIFFEDFVISNH
jgi:hypothetical protein